MQILDTLKIATMLKEGGFDDRQAGTLSGAIAEQIAVSYGTLATKDDISGLTTGLKSEIVAVRSEIRQLESNLKAEMKADAKEAQRWTITFVFSVLGAAVILAGLARAFLHL